MNEKFYFRGTRLHISIKLLLLVKFQVLLLLQHGTPESSTVHIKFSFLANFPHDCRGPRLMTPRTRACNEKRIELIKFCRILCLTELRVIKNWADDGISQRLIKNAITTLSTPRTPKSSIDAAAHSITEVHGTLAGCDKGCAMQRAEFYRLYS